MPGGNRQFRRRAGVVCSAACVLGILTLLSQGAAEAADGPSVAEAFSDSVAYRPVPWWAWTGTLEPEQLERQLREMHGQGLREFFIFPIYGMDVEYMSDTYLERIGQVLEWCKDLGMRAWIYDELNWPSGTAAGRVPRNHPDAVAAQLHLEKHAEAAPEQVRALLEDENVFLVVEAKADGTYAPVEGEPAGPLSVVAFRRKRDQTADLTTRGCLWTTNDPGTLDMLSERAVAAFLQEAYHPIAEAFPDELGKTIKGFFTDEPHFPPGAVPWTDGFREAFQDRFGYDIVPHLHKLVFDTPDCHPYRIDFWSLASEMGSDAFTGQIAEWCEARDMMLTGHLIYEENSYSVWWHGDGPSHLMKMQVPGCDLLGPHTSFEEPRSWYHFGAKSLIKTPKNPASAARFTGRDRVMCEAYGVVPWWKSPADEKRVTDWLVGLGVNLINDNSLITDICDFRKRGIAGKHFTQPYWPDEHLYYEYAGRVCSVSAETVLDTELLLLYPRTTWWAHVRGGTETSPALRELELAFDTAADVLVRRHWDFEFLFEQILENATVADGALVTDYGAFRGVVLAGITHLRPIHAAKLEEFAASGGHVFRVGPAPQAIEGGRARPVNLPDAQVFEDWNDPGFYDNLDRALESRIERPWTVDGPEADGIITAARIDPQEGRYLFLANMTPGDKSLEIAWDGDAAVECWDPDSGGRWRPEQTDGRFTLRLPEDQSLWLAQSAEPVEVTSPPAHFAAVGESAIEIGGTWEFRMDRPNLYNLEYRIKPDTDGTLDAEAALAEEGWLPAVHGDAGVSLAPEDLKAYWISGTFTLAAPVADLELVVDTVLIERAWLNGEALGDSGPVTVWDEHNRKWDIGDRAKAGENTFLLRVLPSPYYARRVTVYPVTLAEPVVLRGTFGVGPDGSLTAPPDRLDPGDWGLQGLPHYAGTGSYINRFAWDGGDALISVEGGRNVVEVLVDGVSLGKRAWAARQFRVRDLSAGEHTLEIRITNTLGGILRRFYSGTQVTDIPACGLLAPPKVARREGSA